MAEPFTTSADRAISFGPFRLLPAQQLLLEGDTQVRLGSRALAILKTLAERAGEVVPKSELMAQVWPDTFVDEGSLRFHIAGLRRALGDGQPGRRYIANIPGRGYQFVAPVDVSGPEAARLESAGAAELRPHNLPFAHTRAVGRASVIETLRGHVSQQRLVTIVGAGGIGKTTVALAVAETLLPTYSVRFVDLAPVDDPQFVPSALGVLLGLALNTDNAIPRLVEYLSDKQMLIVLDSCEHVVGAAASLAEQILAGAPGVHILATSREPLRAQGERLHRLQPLAFPNDPSGCTAAQALTYPAVQLFVERAAAILEGFELTDADAPIVSDICRKLGGVALAIELAAARVDAFGIRQLGTLLDDRFRILKLETRTAQPRHQSLAATLDWSCEFLSDVERAVLHRLSVFAAAFTLEAAIAVADDDDTDVVAALANLVAKSLVSADMGGAVVQYRLLDTTQAYAMQKLIERGQLEHQLQRHAVYHRDMFEQADKEGRSLDPVQWLERYGKSIDDVRNALRWSFSQDGDPSIGVALAIGAIWLWRRLSLLPECVEFVNRALACQVAKPHQELRLLDALGGAVFLSVNRLPDSDDICTRALLVAQSLGNQWYEARQLWELCNFHIYKGDFRKSFGFAEKLVALAAASGSDSITLMAEAAMGIRHFYLGQLKEARRYLNEATCRQIATGPLPIWADQVAALAELANVLWLQGFPDQAARTLELAIERPRAVGSEIMVCNTLVISACFIAVLEADLVKAQDLIATLLEISARNGLNFRFQGHCFQGALLVARGDRSGLTLLRSGLQQLDEAGFIFYTLTSLCLLSDGLATFDETAEAHSTIGKALEQADRTGELWLMPELLRIKGELLRLESKSGETAEDYFLQALDWARRQGALAWELRVGTSLARLWHGEGKTADAEQLLSGVYDRFTEGFSTLDLRTARELIGELRNNPTA